jgi:hypothetical protein
VKEARRCFKCYKSSREILVYFNIFTLDLLISILREKRSDTLPVFDPNEMKLLKRHPLFSLFNSYLVDSPAPSNLSYLWNYGSLLGLCLVIQIITGVTLAIHYTPNIDLAFISVEHLMRDVNYGWLIRYLHSNTASFFFLFVYIHIGKGLYYGSYKEPRVLLWSIGVVIFLLMIITAFLGYISSLQLNISLPMEILLQGVRILPSPNGNLPRALTFTNLQNRSTRKKAQKALAGKSGVYCIRCLTSDIFYIGSAVDLYLRLLQHMRGHTGNSNIYPKGAITKYGLENFEYIVIEFITDTSVLIDTEQKYLDMVSPSHIV